MTILNVLKALTNRIYELFPDIPIHVDESTQRIDLPCFEVFKVSKDQTREPMNRLRYHAIYNVVFISPKDKTLFNLEEIEEQLLIGLEHLYVGDRPIRTDVNSTIIDRDLSITVEIEYVYSNAGNGTKHIEEYELMQKMKHNIN